MGDDSIDMVILEIDMGYLITLPLPGVDHEDVHTLARASPVAAGLEGGAVQYCLLDTARHVIHCILYPRSYDKVSEAMTELIELS